MRQSAAHDVLAVASTRFRAQSSRHRMLCENSQRVARFDGIGPDKRDFLRDGRKCECRRRCGEETEKGSAFHARA